MVTGAFRTGGHLYQSPIAILAMTGRDTLGYDRTFRILTQMDHLRTRIGLLVIIGHGNRVKLTYRVITRQDTARIFPSDRRTGLYLRPRDLATLTFAQTSFRHEVIDTAFTFLITRIPVLYGRILHLSTLVRHDLHDSGMQLVLVTHRRRTSFQITYIRLIVSDNQGTLELSGISGIDTEIRTQLHRATYALRYINKRTVREHGRIQGGEEIITITNHAAQIFLHQVRMMLYSLAERTENNPLLREILLESSLHGNTIHHGVYRHSA